MRIITLDSCPLCGKNTFVPVMECKDHFATGESFPVVRCEHCGFLCTQHFPAEEEMGRYYESPDYISHSNTTHGAMNTVYHWVRRWMLHSKARFLKREAHRKEGRLLDIGAGTGFFAHTMQRLGWQVQATEKSPTAREFAQNHWGLDVYPEDSLNDFEPQSFDVITLWHVLEHLQSLNDTWQRLHTLLDDKGVLVVAVPNAASFDAHYYGSQWAAYDVPRHLWHFTPSTMQCFGAKHGFILQSHRPMPFDAFYVSMLTERNSGHRFPFLRGLWVGSLAWLRSLAGKEKSSSMIYVFRKK